MVKRIICVFLIVSFFDVFLGIIFEELFKLVMLFFGLDCILILKSNMIIIVFEVKVLLFIYDLMFLNYDCLFLNRSGVIRLLLD